MNTREGIIKILTKEYEIVNKLLNQMESKDASYDYVLGERNGLLLAIGLLENKPIDRT